MFEIEVLEYEDKMAKEVKKFDDANDADKGEDK